MADTTPWKRQRWQVPRTDRSTLCVPSLNESIGRIESNTRLFATSASDCIIAGVSLAELRSAARSAAIATARQYTSTWASEESENSTLNDVNRPLILSGHQPQLFHVGVWIKNFVLHRLAALSGGIGLNLVVDSDTCTGTTIRVPVGPRSAPTFKSIPFDTTTSIAPWEELHITDWGTFDSFPNQVAEALRPWGISPLVTEFWPQSTADKSSPQRWVDLVTPARNRWERRWGVQNLELPLSRLCQTTPFLQFALLLFAEADRFREIHNQVLTDYRRVNRVRSRSHPVPPLNIVGEAIETPFRVWKAGDSERRPLFIRRSPHELHLSDGQTELLHLPWSNSATNVAAIEHLQQWQSSGYRLRTRALTTTLFARVCLGDYFIHGIGGAKYDEMTDQIIRQFFGIPVPEFSTVSAALHLPIHPFPGQSNSLGRFRHLAHELQSSPEQFAPGLSHSEIAATVRELRQLQTMQPRSGQLAERARLHAVLKQNRVSITHSAQEQFAKTVQPEWELAAAHAQANKVLASREYSFCLFPAEQIHDFFREQGLA